MSNAGTVLIVVLAELFGRLSEDMSGGTAA
jgi:hypothetical protein